MAEQVPLFKGLLRQPKILGLPVMYAMVWLFSSVLFFLWTQHWVIVVLSAITYPSLRKAADWDANFLDVIVTTLQETPPTANRKIHEGDSYAA